MDGVISEVFAVCAPHNCELLLHFTSDQQECWSTKLSFKRIVKDIAANTNCVTRAACKREKCQFVSANIVGDWTRPNLGANGNLINTNSPMIDKA